jgi:LacI family gluconate utilization system Gnt-I transcriptional repressor
MAKAPDTDAVFCANDDLALGVLFECRRRQISIPEQMLISGLQRSRVHGLLRYPTLTSVRTNRYEMGRNAATMVPRRPMDGRRPEHRVVDPRIHRDGAAEHGAAGPGRSRAGRTAKRRE